ncbi:MAG: ABC transporter substrate-binding protein [Candidatus Daviesbacteria bacterium]
MKTLKFIILFLSRLIRRYILGFFGLLRSPRQISSNLKYFLLAGTALIALILLWCFTPFKSNSSSISEGIIGVYNLNNLPSSVTNLLSEPLVSLDSSGKSQPKLASEWQVNSDATIYTFKLRANLVWSDQSPIKSSDIKFNLPDVEVTYPDDQTISFKLTDSFSPFPTFLTYPVFKGNSLIGAGKYKILSTQKDRETVIKVTLVPTEKENKDLPKITIRFYPDEKTAKTAFNLGEIDSLLGANEERDLINQPGIKEKKIATFNRIVAIFYNVKDPILSDKNLRRALGFAAPEVSGETLAKTSLPCSSWAFNDEVKDYLGDIKTAKTYLDKVELGKESKIALTTTSNFSSLGEKIIQAWKELGIIAVLRIESGIPQNFQALLIQQNIPADPDQYTLWHSTQDKTNISKYSSARVDKDLEDGRKTSDLEKRKEQYVDFQRVLLDDAPATFLYFPKYNVIYREKVENNLNKVLPLQIPQS